MSTDLYPTLAGLTYDVKRTPKFSSRTQDAVSGRQLRILDQPFPIWRWELQYSVLRDKNDRRGGVPPLVGGIAGSSFDELRTIMGFFLARRGSFDTFLFEDLTDNFIDNQQIGVGDGATTQYQLIRAMPYGLNEPVTAPNEIQGIRFNDDLVDPTTYSANSSTGVITFTSPPAGGVVIRVDASFFFRCHFADDSAEFNNWSYQLWELKKVVLESELL